MIPENSLENVYFIWLPCVKLVEDLKQIGISLFFYVTNLLLNHRGVGIFYLADDKGIEDDCVLYSLGIGFTLQMKDTYSTEIED